MQNNFQKKIIFEIDRYIKILKNKKIDTTKSLFCYFACWEEIPGFLNIRKKFGKYHLKLFISFLKSIYAIGRQSGYKLINYNNDKKFKKISITWGYKESFSKTGNFYDLYSNLSSRSDQSTLWFIIYMDKKIPLKLNSNVVLLYSPSDNFKIFYFVKTLFQYLFKFNLNPLKILHYFNSYTNLGNICLDKVKLILPNHQIKKVFLPYEGQIFQKMICNYISLKYKNIITIGFIHDFEPFYPNLIYGPGSPHKLLITCRKEFFIKSLKWPKKNIILSNSLRYKKKDINEIFINKIILPSGIYDQGKIYKNLIKLIKMQYLLKFNIKKFKVRMHPKSTSMHKQKILKDRIDYLIKNEKGNNLVKKFKSKTLIVVGITSLIALSLQKNYRIIQICIDPEVQTFNPIIWKELNIKKVANNIYEYEKKKKSKIFSFYNKYPKIIF